MSKPQVKTKSSLKKIFLIVFGLLLVFAISGVGVGYYLFNYYQKAPSDNQGVYSFIIDQGEAVTEIANRLEREGFIRHNLMFRYIIKKEDLVLQAGEFKLPKNVDVKTLASKLTVGTFDTQVTIIEGWRREEIADYLMTTELYNITTPQVAVSEEALQNQLRIDIINKIKEGYFFPDTYTVSRNTSLPELIQIAKDNFNSKVDSEMISKFEAQGLTVDEAIVLASIVEREAWTDESRPIVAGILLKRYKNDWPLEADATVQYAMADRDCVNVSDCTWWAKEIYEEDLQIDSPFNTRQNLGLPSEAISNPSLSSLSAVAEASDTEYWFYLTGSDGKMYYAKTLDEHNSNIAKYL